MVRRHSPRSGGGDDGDVFVSPNPMMTAAALETVEGGGAAGDAPAADAHSRREGGANPGGLVRCCFCRLSRRHAGIGALILVATVGVGLAIALMVRTSTAATLNLPEVSGELYPRQCTPGRWLPGHALCPSLWRNTATIVGAWCGTCPCAFLTLAVAPRLTVIPSPVCRGRQAIPGFTALHRRGTQDSGRLWRLERVGAGHYAVFRVSTCCYGRHTAE